MLRSVRTLMLITVLFIGSTLHPSNIQSVQAQDLQFVVPQQPGFPLILPPDAGIIGFGSVSLADLDNNKTLEIVVATRNGKVVAANQSGQILWSYDASAAINALAVAQGLQPNAEPAEIRTKPAIADLNGDSVPEIVVTVGDILTKPHNGGIVALNNAGQPLPGWPIVSPDEGGGGANLGLPNGYADGIITSPAVGDVTGDGVPEIIYGANYRIHVRTIDGSYRFPYTNPGDYPNPAKTYGWPQFVLDTIWSSPAIADMNGDGVNDIVVGVDAHNEAWSFAPSHPEAWRYTVEGGDLYVFNGDGSIQWIANQDEIFQSSPAVADIDGNGDLEIIAGTGTYYSQTFNRPVGRYISAWEHTGGPYSGQNYRWRTALPTQIFGSPAIGNLLGDEGYEIAVGGFDGKVYVLDAASGQVRWVVQPQTLQGPMPPNTPLYSPLLADYDGDGLQDVFIAIGWEVAILKGTNGQQFTATSFPSDLPTYYGDHTLDGTPAIGDIDNDGKLELVTASATQDPVFPTAPFNPQRGQINVWELPATNTPPAWPQFRLNAANTGVLVPAMLTASEQRVTAQVSVRKAELFSITIGSNNNSDANWTASLTDPRGLVQLEVSSGSTGQAVRGTVQAPARLAPGNYTAQLTVSAPNLKPVTIPFQVTVINSNITTSVSTLGALRRTGSTDTSQQQIHLSTSDGLPIIWSITENDPDHLISVNRSSGTAATPLQVTIGDTSKLDPGTYTASLQIEARVQGRTLVTYEPMTLPVTVVIADRFETIYLPTVRRGN